MADEVLSSRSVDPEDFEDEVLSQVTPDEVEDDDDPDIVGVDITGDVDPETIDIQKVAAGWRPARRAVTLWNHNLRYLIDLLRDEIDAKRQAGEDVEDDEAKFAEHVDRWLSTGTPFIFEGRSTEWVEELERSLKGEGVDPTGQQKRIEKVRKAHDTKIDAARKKDLSASTIEGLEDRRDADLQPLIADLQEQYRTYIYHRVAAQITNAPGVTWEHIKQIAEVDEPALESLWKTLEAANKDRRVTRDFSQPLSGRRRSG